MTDDQIEMERLMKEQEENIIARTKTNTVHLTDPTQMKHQVDETCALFGDGEEDVDVDDI